MDAVASVRSFNRVVTARVGALQDEYLARGRPIGASRVLWEIADKALREAARLYRAAGYVEVDPFNDEPYAQHWFAKRL